MKKALRDSRALQGLVLVCLIVVVAGVALASVQQVPKQGQVQQSTYSVRLNPRGTETEVYLIDESRRSETRLFALPDVYREHYHAAEFHAGELYVIRRPGGQEAYLTNPAWTDELWRYDSKGNGRKLYTGRGIDFRVSPKAHSIAIVVPEETTPLVFTDLEGSVQKLFRRTEISGLAPEDVIRPLSWFGNDMWLTGVQGMEIRSIFSFDTSTDALTSRDVSSLHAVQREFALEPTTETIAYSTYKQDLEESGNEGQSAELRIYRLQTGEVKTIVAGVVARPFAPRWINSTTLEYADPSGSERVTVRIGD